MRRKPPHKIGLALAILVTPSVSYAAETVTYSYDARGRLIRIEKTGGPNGGVKIVYAHDKASNRKTVKVTGAPN